MRLGKGAGLCVCEATPLFSRPYLYCEGEVTQYLRFKERVADSHKPTGVNPKYWVTAMPSGIFLRYGLSKKGMPSLDNPSGCNQSRVLWARIIYSEMKIRWLCIISRARCAF
jgi:hypothetical protein